MVVVVGLTFVEPLAKVELKPPGEMEMDVAPVVDQLRVALAPELMAAGLAVSATDVGDVKRMLCAENVPFVVPANDEGALAASVLCLLRDRTLASRIGRANRDRAQAEYGIDRMVARYDELYSEN